MIFTLSNRILNNTSRLAHRAPASPSAALRSLSTTTSCRLSDSPPPGNQPPSAKSAGRSSQPVEDQQSSASKKDTDEQLSGDDHPAKQPDAQAPSERSTGFNESAKDGVKGGKEGLNQRTDR